MGGLLSAYDDRVVCRTPGNSLVPTESEDLSYDDTQRTPLRLTVMINKETSYLLYITHMQNLYGASFDELNVNMTNCN